MRRILGGVRFAVLCVLAACGGGGGGGGGGGSATSAPATPIVYAGSTTPAVITAANAGQMASYVLGGGESSASRAVTGVAVVGASATTPRAPIIDLARKVSRASAGLAPRAPSSALAGVTNVDRTDPCDSGSVHVVGTLNDNGTGSLSFTWTNCLSGNDSISGQATGRVDAVDSARNAIDTTIAFTRLAFRAPDANWDMTGSFRLQVNAAAKAETSTVNVVVLNNNTAEIFKTENLVFVEMDDNVASRTRYTQSISGRVYDTRHGYVDITTPTALYFARATDDFPLDGETLFTGAGNRTIRALALSTNAVRLTLDVNGDGNPDNVAILRWRDLGTAASADLADDDGDGMHNSWETTYGLNRSNPGDALLDPDGDGLPNAGEYRGGWIPNSAASTAVSQPPQPIARNLAVATSDYGATGPHSIASNGATLLMVTRQQTDISDMFSQSKWTARVLFPEGGGLPAFDLLPPDSDFSDRSAIAFDGTNYLAVFTRAGAIVGQRISSTGALIDAAPGLTLAAAGGELALAYGNGVFLLVYINGRTVYGVIIQPSGTAGTPFAIHAQVGNEAHAAPAVAFDGTNFLVVWDRKAADGLPETSDIRGVRVANNGSIVGSEFVVSGAAEAQNYPRIACDATNCMVIWVDRRGYPGQSYNFEPGPGDMYGARVAANNTVLDVNGFAVATGITANAGYPGLTYNGSQYIAVWSRGAFINNPGGPTGVYSARIGMDASVNLGGTSTGTAVSGPPPSGARLVYPSIISTPSGAFVSWLNQGEASTGLREVDAVLAVRAP